MTSRGAHTPGPWIIRRVEHDNKLAAILLETEAPNPPHNDPVILAVREDWLGYIDRVPDGYVNLTLIASAPELVEALELAYIALLNSSLAYRIGIQYQLCACRDALARATGRSEEDTQNHYEAMALEARGGK